MLGVGPHPLPLKGGSRVSVEEKKEEADPNPFLPRPLLADRSYDGDIPIPEDVALVIEELKRQRESRRALHQPLPSLPAPPVEEGLTLVEQTVIHLIFFLMISAGSVLGSFCLHLLIFMLLKSSLETSAHISFSL